MRAGHDFPTGQIAEAGAVQGREDCVNDAPKGFRGAYWGESAAVAADGLGIRCGAWTPWEGGAGFEACFATGSVDVFGAPGLLRLVRRGVRLCGIQVDFGLCTP